MSSPTLLPSLARAIRGLSALFWGLPLTLFVTANLALGMSSQSRAVPIPGMIGTALNTLSAVFPAVFAQVLVIYGLKLLKAFQAQERVWVAALERAQLIAWLNVGLVPFAFWFSRRPQETLFSHAFLLSLFSALAFLAALNHVLRRLAAMLPDETLRADTRTFTALNIRVLIVLGILLGLTLWVGRSRESMIAAGPILSSLARFEPWHLLLPGLLPVALTMTMLWKTKEVILMSVFGGPRQQ